jgi:sugar lactone lactonase YvrE
MHSVFRYSRVALALSAAATVVWTVGCGSSHPAAPPTGSLTVTINPANGTAASVVVTGPNFSKTLSATQTLSGLALGSYTIVADTAVGPDSIVGTIVDTGAVTGSPASVTANQTAAATVSYAMKYRVGGMWVANNSYQTLPELAANQLRTSGTPVLAETLSTQVPGPAGLAIDAYGTMWESAYNSNQLLGYSVAARNAGGAPTATITITSSSIADAECLAFDAQGNLWIADRSAGLLKFTPSQLAASGTQSASIVIAPSSVLSAAEAMAFDANGNVWVADWNKAHIVEFTAAQLASSAAPAPADTIGLGSGSITGIAFDAAGNLWALNRAAGAISQFTPAQLTASGSPTPNVKITLPGGIDGFGMAFDKRGTLWVSDYNGIMWGLTSSQLASTGSPAPAVADTIGLGDGFQPEQPVFDAYATAVGISASRVRSPAHSLAHSVRRSPNSR